MHSFSRAICLALVGVSLTAAAASDPLAQARAAMASASFEKALAIADKALKSARDAGRRGRLELVRAECFHALRKTAQMKEALAEALREDPLAAYEANSVNPELAASLDQQRSALAGRLIISGSFASGEAPQVSIDGVKLGPAPVTAPADVGRHRVKVSWPGGDRQEEEVVIRPEADSTLVLSRAASGAPVRAERAERSKRAARAERDEQDEGDEKDEQAERGEERLVPSPEVSEDSGAPELVEAPRKGRTARKRWPVVAIGAGVLLTVGGVVCLGVARGRYDALTGGAGTSTLMLDRAGAMAWAAQGQTIQIIGIVLTVVGLAALGAAGLGLGLASSDP